jgi:hypothetical protein
MIVSLLKKSFSVVDSSPLVDDGAAEPALSDNETSELLSFSIDKEVFIESKTQSFISPYKEYVQ